MNDITQIFEPFILCPVLLVDRPMKNSSKIFDGLLVLEYQSGNKKALSILVKRYQKDFISYAYWYTGNLEMAQDVIQDSWGSIIKALYSLKKPDSFKSWAIRIITRKAQDHLKAIGRRRSFEQKFQPQIQWEEDQTRDRESQLAELNKAIKNLSKDHQIVIRLFYKERQSLREISEILEISQGTVKSRLYHAREKLKTLIK